MRLLEERGGVRRAEAKSDLFQPIHAGARWELGLLNGKASGQEMVFVSSGTRYRFRLANIGETFPFRVCIDGHQMTVIASDGSDTKPLAGVDCVMIHSAERFDVIIHANQAPRDYMIRATTPANPAQYVDQIVLGVLRYNDSTWSPSPISLPSAMPLVLNCFELGFLYGTGKCVPLIALQRLPTTMQPPARRNFNIAFDVQISGTPYPQFGHFVRIEKRANGVDPASGRMFWDHSPYERPFVQHAEPHLPPLIYGWNNASVREHTNVMEFAGNATVTVVLFFQDGVGIGRFSHPMHLHGHKFHVLGVGYPDPRFCSIVRCPPFHPYMPYESGRYSTSPGAGVGVNNTWSFFVDPSEAPLKDTITVPGGGWVVLQLVGDNPGEWLAHCHVDAHHHDGLAWIMREAPEVPRVFELPPDFPVCHAPGSRRLDIYHDPPQCDCFFSPDSVMKLTPENNYKCSADALCRHTQGPLSGVRNLTGVSAQERVRGNYRSAAAAWGVALAVIAAVVGFIVLNIFLARLRILKVNNAPAELKSTFSFVNEPKMLEWRNIVVMDPATNRLLLSCVSGRCESGRVLSILGASGSGKTVLLDVLGGVALRGMVKWSSGSILFGRRNVLSIVHEPGGASSGCLNASLLAYATIDEEPPLHLTVQENLEYFAALARPPGMTDMEVLVEVTKVISRIGLAHVSGTKGGLLSQGQKTRLKLASYLLFPASVVLLDEPLSGLDSVTAIEIYRLLAELAREKGVAIVLTLHMPNAELLSLTDRVMILEKGNVAYWGSVDALNDHLETMGLGNGEQDAVDSIIRLLDQEFYKSQGPDRQRALRRLAKASILIDDISLPVPKPKAGVKGFVKRISRVISITKLNRMKNSSDMEEIRVLPPLPRASLWGQLRVLTLYAIKERAASIFDIYSAVLAVGLGTITGLVWFQVGLNDTRRGVQEVLSLLFYAMTVWVFNPLYPAIIVMGRNYITLKRERSRGLYSLWIRNLVQGIVEFLFLLCWPMIFSLICFTIAYLGVLPSSNVIKGFILGLCAACFNSLGLLMGILFSDTKAALAVATLGAQTSLILAGFYTTLPAGATWLRYFSIPGYVYVALLQSEFSWRDSTQCIPSESQSNLGPYHCFLETMTTFDDLKVRGIAVVDSPVDTSPWVNVWPLLVMFVGFRFISHLLIARRLRKELSLHSHAPKNASESKWRIGTAIVTTVPLLKPEELGSGPNRRVMSLREKRRSGDVEEAIELRRSPPAGDVLVDLGKVDNEMAGEVFLDSGKADHVQANERGQEWLKEFEAALDEDGERSLREQVLHQTDEFLRASGYMCGSTLVPLQLSNTKQILVATASNPHVLYDQTWVHMVTNDPVDTCIHFGSNNRSALLVLRHGGNLMMQYLVRTTARVLPVFLLELLEGQMVCNVDVFRGSEDTGYGCLPRPQPVSVLIAPAAWSDNWLRAVFQGAIGFETLIISDVETDPSVVAQGCKALLEGEMRGKFLHVCFSMPAHSLGAFQATFASNTKHRNRCC